MNAIVKIGDTELQPVRLTREAIIDLADSGWFDRIERMEIIDGVMVRMSPSWLPHGRALVKIAAALSNSSSLVVSSDQLVLFGDSGMHAPDIAVFDAGFSKREPDSGDLRFAIEIAEASLAYDLGIKAERYAAFGIPEYWVVDLENRRTVVHRVPTVEGYGDITSHAWSESLSPGIVPEIGMILADILA